MADKRATDVKITPLKDGPLLVTGLTRLSNSKGALEAQPKTALCRCGASKRKPFCDGSHTAAGFSGAKLDTRTEDRRDSYVGREITVHDNRGTCSHAGLCTGGLPAVWRMKEEPWIDPDGAAAEEIMRVIESCPSGALRYTRDGVEGGDVEREAAIHVAKDGPFEVVGGPELVGETFGIGVSREHFALCRCGGSKNKPFCDGSHWSLEFKDEDN